MTMIIQSNGAKSQVNWISPNLIASGGGGRLKGNKEASIDEKKALSSS